MESTDVGWSAVPNWLIRDSDLGTYELLVFIALLNRADKRGEAWPSLPTLQRDARASKDSVLRALRALEERGLVEVVKRRNEDGSNASNLYRVHPHGGSRSQRPPSRSQRPGGSLTATGVVAHSDGGSRSQRPEVLPIEVLPIEEDTVKDSSRFALDRAFETAWESWPKKTQKKTARERFLRAAKTRPVDELVDDVRRFGEAYAATTEKRFTPALDTWLLKERWTDELPSAPRPQQDRPREAAMDRNLRQLRERMGGADGRAGSGSAADQGVGGGQPDRLALGGC